MSEQFPELNFEENKAKPRFPIPILKHAVLVPVQDGYPTHVRPEWDDTGLNPQVFIGSWYAMLSQDGSQVRYGSAQKQWENMHIPVAATSRHPKGWLKVLVPTGYHTEETLDVVTLIDDRSQSTGFREARKTIGAGTLVLKQPGGEIQHVRPEDEECTYFSEAQASYLGLPNMPVEQFATWAVANAIEPSYMENSTALKSLFTKA